MTANQLHILPTALLPTYCEAAPEEHQRRYEDLQDRELSMESFSFYNSVAAVYSNLCKIRQYDEII